MCLVLASMFPEKCVQSACWKQTGIVYSLPLRPYCCSHYRCFGNQETNWPGTVRRWTKWSALLSLPYKTQLQLDSKNHATNLTRANFIKLNGDAMNSTRFNTFRSRQNGRYFTDDIFKCIFLNENVWNCIEISLKCVPKHPINTIPALV